MLPWWAIILECYVGIGFVYYVYLFNAGRVEGSLSDAGFQMAFWPLELACWLEKKFINR